ncbi:MAG: citrate transporter [Tenericutes bacterium]|nr:citrate transporter [Mycoplasmatota bacterium]
MKKYKKNNIGSFFLITLIYLISTLIALFTKISIKEIMHNYQYSVLIILIIMELFTNLISSTGIMEMLSIKMAILSKGKMKLILVLFGFLMFFISAFLNNITAVMMILPIVFVLLKTIGVNQKYLNIFFSIILALSNTGGASSPIGDFPAIVIMNSGITSFLGYLFRAFPTFLLTSILLIVWWKREIKDDELDIAQKMLSIDLLKSRYKNLEVKKDVLFGLLIIFLFMFVGWSFIPQEIIPSEIIAVLGYVIAMLFSKIKGIKVLQDVDFKPVLTISSFLFLAEIVSNTGILNNIALYLQTNITNSKYLLIIIMVITSIVSGIFGAGPAASAMMPVIINLCSTTFASQSDWVAIAYAASICAGSSLFMWSATAGFILSKEINSANLIDKDNNKKMAWNITDYFKYGFQNCFIQLIIAIIEIYIVV